MGVSADLVARIAATVAILASAAGSLPAQAQLSKGKGDLRVFIKAPTSPK
jgi:hypothetical protein